MPAYAGRTRPTVAEAIGWIHDAGGLAVWAHPFWDIAEDDAVLDAIDRYRAAGLDGVECFYVTHDEHQTSAACRSLRRARAAASASSDYHGPDHRLFNASSIRALRSRAAALGTLLAEGDLLR
jgi:predicted metal-dependent phosphoesterase TrpH